MLEEWLLRSNRGRRVFYLLFIYRELVLNVSAEHGLSRHCEVILSRFILKRSQLPVRVPLRGFEEG